jgi:endonuclease YncB( thermonuclease family)
MRSPLGFQTFPPSMRVPFGPFRAIVEYIVDGDTIDCFIDAGFHVYRYNRIRLAGINAPEKNRGTTANRQTGIEAMHHLASLLPVGMPVLLATEPDPDDFGRYIAIVTTEDGTVVNDRMVSDGHAVYKHY